MKCTSKQNCVNQVNTYIEREVNGGNVLESEVTRILLLKIVISMVNMKEMYNENVES